MADPVQMYLADVCTLPVNMAGLPGISIPCGLSEGLPVGLQLIGPAWSEAELLRAARAYEGVTAGAAWRAVRPRDLDALRDPSIRRRPSGWAPGLDAPNRACAPASRDPRPSPNGASWGMVRGGGVIACSRS